MSLQEEQVPLPIGGPVAPRGDDCGDPHRPVASPKNQLIVVAFTFFQIIQYAVTIFFLIKRIERLRDEPPPVQSEPEQA